MKFELRRKNFSLTSLIFHKFLKFQVFGAFFSVDRNLRSFLLISDFCTISRNI
uniref:Uncharacterized protein n=1 Tax=Rhizophora mucronata TaxID=61149 RepID=A0A2P2JR28_RHIMU